MNFPEEVINLINKLPLTSPSFSHLLQHDLIYVDKTPYIEKLVKNYGSTYVFLSRPRRFGKSLLLDTIANLFQGREELFRGLYIHDKWDWSKRYPVIRLDLSTIENPFNAPLEEEMLFRLNDGLLTSARSLHVHLDKNKSPDILFKDYIVETYYQYNETPVVILIDEYDIPIISNILSAENAEQAKTIMHSFYKTIKSNSSYIRFVMLTGISKFSGISVFSALNNLLDISLESKFSAICGYTESELDKYFKPFMDIIDRNQFREMYNGYNWLGETVYNPVDVMKAIRDSVSNGRVDCFKSFWFKTGTPTFLVDLMKKRGVLIPDLNENGISAKLFSEIDINYLEVEPLLFQTGYLTIDSEFYDEKSGDILYRLKYPNKEVEISYSSFFLNEVFKGKEERAAFNRLDHELYIAFKTGDCQKLFDEIHLFFASLTHRWYQNNTIASAEGFYCGILFAIFRANAGYLEAESHTNHGQLDIFTRVGNKRYIIEVKVRENAKGKKGLNQILKKGYAEKYRDDGELYLVGMEFSSEERNIVELEYCVGVDGERTKIKPKSKEKE